MLTGRVAGLIRLTHPFPSLLDGGATLAIALLAGGRPSDALRLGVAMIALQVAIGTINDLVDVPRDAGRKPGKPIPAGLVGPTLATLLALVAAAVGLVLSLPSGLAAGVLAVLILAIGLLYDLWLRGTAWSWLPFALGIPLLPVYAWVGATGRIPALFIVLVPTAFISGAGLAIANALADVERDADAGARSVARQLGPAGAWTAHAMLQVTVVAVALASLLGAGAGITLLLGAAGATAVVLAGVWLTRNASPASRERGWELEAVGTAVLAAVWIAAVAPVAG
jgi:4-hydroxybenzoate polyprenyltransferase